MRGFVLLYKSGKILFSICSLFIMATGQEEDALLGLDSDDSSVIKVLLPSLQGIQNTMLSVATGIEKMGEAWTSFIKKSTGSYWLQRVTGVN